jgi:hypothetical protein
LIIFYPVFKAAKALIDLIQSHAKEGYPPDNLRPVRLLVYIDESHEMTTDKQTLRDDGRNAYQMLCSSLNELLKLDLFFVFLSTNSNLQEYSPSPRIFWSKRGRNSTLAYVQTPYTELPFDIWIREQLVTEGRYTVDVVCAVEFMVRFGRPLCVHLIWNSCYRGLNRLRRSLAGGGLFGRPVTVWFEMASSSSLWTNLQHAQLASMRRIHSWQHLASD